MQLAQLNIAKARYSLDAPEISDFVDNLDNVNAIAESCEALFAYAHSYESSAPVQANLSDAVGRGMIPSPYAS